MKAILNKISIEECRKEVMNPIDAIQLMSKLGYKSSRAQAPKYRYEKWEQYIIFENGTSTFYTMLLTNEEDISAYLKVQ